MRVKLEIDSPEEARAVAEAIYRWAANANDSRNLTAEIGAVTSRLIMVLDEYLTDCAITFVVEERRNEQNLVEWSETGSF